MYDLSNIGPRRGAKRKPKRVGRGAGSGHGRNAGRGIHGQKSREGQTVRPGFEGGQMPLHRRLPKRGFKNPFRKTYAIVNLNDLPDGLESGTVVDRAWLNAHGLIPKTVGAGVKVLGDGEISTAITVRVERVSRSARSKIESAGGTVELV